MEFDEVFEPLTKRLTELGRLLSPVEILVLQGSWNGETYAEIADQARYTDKYLKNDVGPGLFKKLSEALGQQVNKRTFRSITEAYLKKAIPQESLILIDVEDEKDAKPLYHFVGRESAFGDIDQHKQRNVKAVLIFGKGGIGKSVLAHQYLESRFGEKILDFRLARHENLATSIEYQIQEKLRDQLNEDPGQEFIVSLERFKRKLQEESWGIWIDNLEPLLNSKGKFLEQHVQYKQFLDQVICNPLVKSFCIITSREVLHEGLEIEVYKLKELTLGDWSNYFAIPEFNRDAFVILKKLHTYYGGNALVMKNIRQTVLEDYPRSGLPGYYKDNPCHEGSGMDQRIHDLIVNQFNRLKSRNPDAHNLICRMGCFRYQEVSTVPKEALFSLLWDLKEKVENDIINQAKNSGLIEFEDGEFLLHPYIHQEAINRLTSDPKLWKKANISAALFWKNLVIEVINVADANRALESYHHFLEAGEFQEAGKALDFNRKNTWSVREPLSADLYRLGLTTKCINFIEKITPFIDDPLLLSKLYNALGDSSWMIGNLNYAIQCHERSRIQAEIQLAILNDHDLHDTRSQESVRKAVVSLFNIGLCKIDFYELEEAEVFFKSAISEGKKYNPTLEKLIVQGRIDESEAKLLVYDLIYDSSVCLAFLNAVNGREEAATYLEKAIKEFDCFSHFTNWSKGYIPIYIGLACKAMNLTKEAERMYQDTIEYAEIGNFKQAKAKALTGLSEIYRDRNNFSEAFKCHSESIILCDKIAAKSDLAEAYLQQGVTYQKMDENAKAGKSFAQAEKLWRIIDAPRQIERLERIRQGES